MRIKAAISGNLEQAMAKELESASKGVTEGIRRGQHFLKARLRRQTRRVLGDKVANAWTTVWGKEELFWINDGINAAAEVRSKAPKIIQSMTEGALIRSKAGKFLAIPSEKVRRIRRGKHRVTPSDFRLGNALRFVPLPNGHGLLVRKDAKRKKNGQLRKDSIMFVLVPAVRIPRKLPDYKLEADRVNRILPRLILQEMRRQAERPTT